MSLLYRTLFPLCAVLAAFPCSGEDKNPEEAPAPPSHELYFSPQDKVDARLIALIETEKEDIRAAVYCLTHRGVIKALMDARKRGVNVELVVDPYTIKARCPLKRMAQAGISIYIWDPKPLTIGAVVKEKDKEKPRKPLMHNKFCIFGQKTVWTGSFNFTSEASKSNQENVVVLRDQAAARKYLGEFERVKEEGSTPFRTYLANQPAKKKKAKLL